MTVAHFAIVFEIDAPAVEDLHRLDHPRRTLAGRMSERGKSKQGQTRLVTQAACNAGSFDSDIGDLMRFRHFGHGSIGNEYGAATRHHDRNADHAMPGLGIDDA
jgi:hypothetical protein